MPTLKIFTVDAFTSKPFRGNPAGVCILENQELSEQDMRNIAAEMNISETAFLVPLDHELANHARRFALRWFTPTSEVPLCGHGTLASAYTLFMEFANKSIALEFDTLSGTLIASKRGDSIVLDFPANPPEKIDPEAVKEIIEIIGLDAQEVWYCTKTKKLMVRLSDSYDLETFRSMPVLNPDRLLQAKTDYVIKSVVVTLKGREDFDFFSRNFAPWVGIPEDPVTGAAHTVLAPYWSKELGKTDLKAFQCSPRGGEMVITVRYDGRVDLAGKAVTVLRGELQL